MSGSDWSSGDGWTPDELTRQRAEADQVLAVLTETAKYDTDVEDEKLRRSVDRVMAGMRRACTTVPEDLWDNGFHGGGGSDLAPVIDPAMPKWSKDFPEHASVVIFSWKPGNRWIVRMPLSPRDILRMVVPPAEMKCEHHQGSVRDEASYLTVARGQYVVALVVCRRCRRLLDHKYPEALHWHTPATTGPFAGP